MGLLSDCCSEPAAGGCASIQVVPPGEVYNSFESGSSRTLKNNVTIGPCEELNITFPLLMNGDQLLINYGTINVANGTIYIYNNINGIQNYGTINLISGYIHVTRDYSSMLANGIWVISDGFTLIDSA